MNSAKIIRAYDGSYTPGPKFLPSYWLDRMNFNGNTKKRWSRSDQIFYTSLFGTCSLIMSALFFMVGTIVGILAVAAIVVTIAHQWILYVQGTRREKIQSAIETHTSEKHILTYLKALAKSENVDQASLGATLEDLRTLIDIAQDQTELIQEYRQLGQNIDVRNNQTVQELYQALDATKNKMQLIAKTLRDLYHEETNLKAAQAYQDFKQKRAHVASSDDIELVSLQRLQSQIEAAREVKNIEREVQFELQS